MDLADDEKVIFEGHPSWRSILRFYLAGLVVAVVGGVIAAAADSTGLGLGVYIAIIAIVIVVGWLRRLGTTYAISDHRLYIRHGLVARREQHTRLDRVQNVNTDQSLIERVLRIGTVDFDTAGTDDADFAFRGVANPRQVVHAVDQALHAAAQTARAESQAAGGPGAGGEAGPAGGEATQPATGDTPPPATRGPTDPAA